ncbi:MAG: universal stress protein [Desulfobulbaceae bacterium]|nr:universal stress protein [Desulfobulbaceae bacterium]
MEKKLLVAIGNSGLDTVTINYLINIFENKSDISLHLLTVIPLSGITESQRLLGDLETVAASRPGAQKKRVAARKHQESLLSKLLSAGFDKKQMSSEVSFCWGNVSSLLVQQAQAGVYDAIVLAKRDLSLLQKMMSGSISSDLWIKNHSVPLWIINGTPASRNFLVPVDCSRRTLSAVDHLGFIMQGNKEIEITLFHSSALLADNHIPPKEDFYEKWGKEWCDEHIKGKDDEHFHFHAAKQILLENGFAEEKIHCDQIDSGIEPAQMIVREVKKHTYSTIVMGRRMEKEKNIFKGVSDRVLANVHDVALWILG